MKNQLFYDLIEETFSRLEKNNMGTLGMPEKRLFEAPLVGIAMGSDPFFNALKERVSSSHWSVEEAFRLKYSEDIEKSNLRVVSLVFPLTAEIIAAQRNAKEFPAAPWIVANGEWKQISKELCGKLEKIFDAMGKRTLFIDLQPQYDWRAAARGDASATWSHDQIGHGAGNGTFGLTKGLITRRGKAVKLTSFIIEDTLGATLKTYIYANEWCLFYRGRGCAACLNRCPAGAISFEGHNKEICLEYERKGEEGQWQSEISGHKADYIFDCGICQVGLPCTVEPPIQII